MRTEQEEEWVSGREGEREMGERAGQSGRGTRVDRGWASDGFMQDVSRPAPTGSADVISEGGN